MAARGGKSKATLGDGLVAPLRKGKPVNLVVARSEVVAGQIRLKVDAPKTIRGAPGAKLLVKHVYRLQEGSPDREEYRILLRSTLNGKEHAPSLGRFGDAYAMPDDYSGFLVHEYILPASGAVNLAFEVAAEYTIGDWKTETVDQHQIRRAEGDVKIVL
ncbi:MAG: hypothetical protein AABY18_09865 [Candidatus Thermoplasmatota archaeon]